MTAKDIAKVLLSLSDTSQDAIIEALVAQCEDYLKAQNLALPLPQTLLANMVVELYNKLGGAGLSSSSFSSVSESYLDGFSQDIMQQIYSMRRVKFI